MLIHGQIRGGGKGGGLSSQETVAESFTSSESRPRIAQVLPGEYHCMPCLGPGWLRSRTIRPIRAHHSQHRLRHPHRRSHQSGGYRAQRTYRRRIKTQEKAKVVAVDWGDLLECCTNHLTARMFWSSIFSKHPFCQVAFVLFILLFKSSWWKIASAARNWI